MYAKHLEPIIKAAGGAMGLARKLRITPAAIYQWDQIPISRVLEVERITGFKREQMRPDIFGKSA